MARPASDISSRILHAARERFLLEGVDGASLRNIAKDAGTNIGMVYYYFKTKDELFEAVVAEVYTHILDDIKATLSADTTPEQRLSQLYARVAALSDEEFQVVRLLLREALISSARLSRIARLFLEGHIPLVLRMMADGSAHGRLRSDLHPVALMAATFVLGLMPQIARRLLASTDLPFAGLLPSGAAVADTMISVLLEGIAARSGKKD
jgi:AcrR family transcriptional regulator